MARPRKRSTKVDDVEPGSVDELTRIIALTLRYQGVPMGAPVHDLSDAGLQPGRIATLLSTSSASVGQQKYAKRPVWPKKEASNGGQ